ncbi:MAG: hypothetical protein IKL68_02110 [Clostridia bacterium]|nr:hypothetical protein [Clostridia bacterium]
MRIPKIIHNRNREYIFVKEYKDYIRYKDMITGSMTCFDKQELGLVKEIIKPNIAEGRIGRRKL